ncbi:MAG: type II secretion system protein GspF [Deltaproteobacteria bacterium]|nr:MAG: type II secretion system protein GspF [Deltaproteobacteria bacterium]
MAVYEYRGLDKAGKSVSGIIDADNPKVARARLRKQAVYPTEIHLQKKGKTTRGSGLNVEIDFAQYFQRISGRDISILTRQMATLLGANVPMAETLHALVEQSEKQKLKIVLSEVKERVNEGSTLADALGKHPKVFNNLFVQMVRAGERSGALPQVLQRLAVFAEASVKLQSKIWSAMLYPILMAIIGVGILTGLFVFVVPQMRELLDGFSSGGTSSLPFVTQIVFFIGDALTSGLACVFAALAVAGFFVFRWWIRNSGKRSWHAFVLKVPLVGRLTRMVSVSRFCRTLATLLVSGVPIITALGIVKSIVGNVIIQDAVEDASKNIQEGQSIAAPLKKSGQFPPMVIHMIAIGERTGELESMLTNVADAYENEVDTTVEGLTGLLGPLMIVAMGGAVFFIALGLLLPLSQMTQTFAN